MPKGYYNISGFWDEQELYYINSELNFCQNTTENNNHCLPQDDIIQYFLEKDRYLTFFINDINVDASKPIRSPFTSKLITNYFLVDIKLRKSYEVYLKQTNLLTTEGFIFQDEFKDSTFQIDQIKSDLNTRNAGSFNIAFFNFLSSDVQTNITRKYSDIQEAFSNMSGILNCIIALGLIMSNVEHNFRIVRELTSNLFVFQDLSMIGKKKKDNEKKSEINRMMDEKEMNDEKNKKTNQEIFFKRNSICQPKKEIVFISERKDSQPRTNFSSCIEKKETNSPSKGSIFRLFANLRKSRKSSVDQPIKRMESFESFKKSQKKFEFGILKYLKIIIKCKNLFLSNEEKLFLKAEHEIKSQMDITEILKKLHDIEKLKKILLNKNEQFLFNLLDKPYIYLEKDELNILKSKNMRRVLNWSPKIISNNLKKNEIFESYKSIKDSGSEIGQRILNLIDRDVVKFIQNEG